MLSVNIGDFGSSQNGSSCWANDRPARIRAMLKRVGLMNSFSRSLDGGFFLLVAGGLVDFTEYKQISCNVPSLMVPVVGGGYNFNASPGPSPHIKEDLRSDFRFPSNLYMNTKGPKDVYSFF